MQIAKNRRDTDPYSNAFSRCLQFAHEKASRAKKQHYTNWQGNFFAEKSIELFLFQIWLRSCWKLIHTRGQLLAKSWLIHG